MSARRRDDTRRPSSGWLLPLALVSFAEPSAADSERVLGAADVPADARSDTSHASLELCVAEHEKGRLFRNELRLFESRSALARCAENDCPLAIRADCASWLSELEALIPTVLLVVEGADGSTAVRVTVDGRLLGKRLDEPLELSPGVHRFRFEQPPHAPLEREIVLAPGEKNRVVRVRFARPRDESRPVAAVMQAPPLTPSRPVPAATYWFGAGALLLGTTSVVLAGSAIIDESRANEQCAPRCPATVRESIERRLLFADIAGGVALGLTGFAVHSYLTRPTVAAGATQPRVVLQASKGGATMSIGGRF